MTIQRPAKKRKTFKSGVTNKLLLLILLALGASGFLLYFGFSRIAFLESNHWRQQFEYVAFGYMPIGLGVIILFVLVGLLGQGLAQNIVITPQALAYQKGKVAFTETWEQLTFYAKKESKNVFMRSFTIGNKDRTVRIDSIFFSQYDVIIEIVKVAKESRRTSLMDVEL